MLTHSIDVHSKVPCDAPDLFVRQYRQGTRASPNYTRRITAEETPASILFVLKCRRQDTQFRARNKSLPSQESPNLANTFSAIFDPMKYFDSAICARVTVSFFPIVLCVP
jgi:hypothetical protein